MKLLNARLIPTIRDTCVVAYCENNGSVVVRYIFYFTIPSWYSFQRQKAKTIYEKKQKISLKIFQSLKTSCCNVYHVTSTHVHKEVSNQLTHLVLGCGHFVKSLACLIRHGSLSQPASTFWLIVTDIESSD